MASHHSRHRGWRKVHDTAVESWTRIESIVCSTDNAREGYLIPLSQETTDFVGACVALHQRLAQHGSLTEKEIDLIEFSALDLLDHVKPLD